MMKSLLRWFGSDFQELGVFADVDASTMFALRVEILIRIKKESNEAAEC